MNDDMHGPSTSPALRATSDDDKIMTKNDMFAALGSNLYVEEYISLKCAHGLHVACGNDPECMCECHL